MYYVCILESINFRGKRYTGFTSDLNKRLKEHNNGKTRSNKAYRPFRILYYEAIENREDARKREKYFKSSAGRIYLNKIIRPHSSAE